MRAAVMRSRKLVVADIPLPEPGPGEVLVKTLACGICGSDLHALKHAERFVENQRRVGARFVMDLDRDVVMGTSSAPRSWPSGPDNVAPAGRDPGLLHPGPRPPRRRAHGRLLQRDAGRLRRVHAPHRVAPAPRARGPLHRARRADRAHGGGSPRGEDGEPPPDDAPLVIGCGPVGLAVIAALRLTKARPIVAADFSPRRRALAEALGADVVVDPAADTPWTRWAEVATWRDPTRAPVLPPWVPAPPRAPPWCSSAWACRACSISSWGRAARPASWWWACAWSPTPSTPCWGSARSCLPVRAGLHRRRVRGDPAPHRGRPHPHRPADHRPGGAWRAWRAPSPSCLPERHAKIIVEPWRP